MTVDLAWADQVPAPSWRPDTLLRLEERHVDDLRGFMRSLRPAALTTQPDAALRALTAFAAPLWSSGIADVRPHQWIRLLEPQVTSALRQFMSTGPASLRRDRIACFIRASWSATGKLIPDIGQVRRAEIHSEANIGQGRRTDILAWAEDSHGARLGVLIEAKIGHAITTGQLKSYEAGSTTRFGLSHDNAALLVVAPALTTDIARQLKRNPTWAFVSWRKLLLSLGQELHAGGCDDDDFRRFRRTLFDQLSGAPTWNPKSPRALAPF